MSKTFSESGGKSLISIKSQQLLETASRISKNNLLGIGMIKDIRNDELVSKCWGAFGLYISRQMRMGRGILIPHFGTFSFSAPVVQLDGVTNPIIRDKQKRQPVFLISKDFANGQNLKTGIFIDNHIRPYTNQTSGNIQIVKINFSEISAYVQQSKDATKFAIERTIRVISDNCRKGQNVDIQIPGVGNFHAKNNIVAIHFNHELIEQTQEVIKRPLSERRSTLNIALTNDNLKSLSYGNQIDQNYIDSTGKQFLEQNLDINLDKINSFMKITNRPSSAGPRNTQSLHQRSLLDRSIGVPQLNKPDTLGDLQSFKKNVSDLDHAIKMLKFWIRQNSLNSEDAYLECCNNVFGRTSDRRVYMTLPQFIIACDKMELGLSQDQVNQLFDYLDANKDGNLSYLDWVQTINENSTHLHYIRDSVFKNKLHADDVLKTMGFHRMHSPINLGQLKQGMLNLDLSLDQTKAQLVAFDLLKGRETITMSEIIQTFDCIEEEDKIYDASWFKDILFKIKEKLVNSNNYQSLKIIFEANDHHNIGQLQTNDFKKCLMKSVLKLSVTDINRIVRYLPKIKDGYIDYYQFLKQIDRVDVISTSDQKIGDIYEFAEKLQKYLKGRNIEDFLKNVKDFSKELSSFDQIGPDGEVNIEQVTEYLHQNVFQKSSRNDLQNYVKELDIDCDGYILENDLTAFLAKYNYFESVYFSKPEPTRDLIRNKSYSNNHISLNTKGLFPANPLPESKINNVLRDLRRSLEMKNISFPVFFSMIDNDKDGFITIYEFSQSIGKVLPLSQTVIDGVFSYIDKLRIGMIDYSFFLKFLNKSVAQPEEEVKQDTYDWQYNMIMQIRQWFALSRLSIEDAFKTLDKNYKGEINEDDLYNFLQNVIKVKEADLIKSKVNRLFKLMDQFKKGRIQCEDFRRLLCEDFAQGEHKCIMGHQVIDNFSSFDWKLNARQQIGLILTRKFKDISQSYNIISGYRKKLLFMQFKTWTTDVNCLNGFDISENQLLDIYADLDTHKKGYLTEQDWITAFKGFDWKRQMVEEIKEVLHNNFGSMKKAFQFFDQKDKSGSIDFKTFSNGIDYLMPKRFIASDVKDLWSILSNDQDSVDIQQFQICFGRKNGLYKEQYLNINEQQPIQLNGKSLKEVQQETPVTLDAPFTHESLLERLRRYLRTLNHQIQSEFEKIDKGGSGILTNLQFSKILKQMNFALKQEEIDVLLNLCNQEGKINWKRFLNLIKLQETDHLIIDRAKIKFQYYAQLIYTYMLSPKDAFRTFDVNSKGVLIFEQFQKLIQELTYLANEEMPSYIIVKDMFEFLDQKKDGFIDLTEWMEVFSKYEYIPYATIPKSKSLYQLQDDQQIKSVLQPKKDGKSNQNSLKNVTNIKFKQRPLSSHYQVKQVNFNNNIHQPILYRENILSQSEIIKQQKLGEWESTKEFDKILTAIGRNRKFLLQIFHQISKRQFLSYQVVRSIIEQMLRNSGIELPEEGWPVLIKFAEKNGAIDFRFMLDVYKERIQKIDQHPIQIQKN